MKSPLSFRRRVWFKIRGFVMKIIIRNELSCMKLGRYFKSREWLDTTAWLYLDLCMTLGKWWPEWDFTQNMEIECELRSGDTNKE